MCNQVDKIYWKRNSQNPIWFFWFLPLDILKSMQKRQKNSKNLKCMCV